MDATIEDWLVAGCALVSMGASLSVPVILYYARALPRSMNPVRLARKESYAALLGLAAQTRDRFQSAAIRQKLQRMRPDQAEISAQVDDDLSAGWAALAELEHKLQADQLICSDKVIALVADAKAKHFCNAESLFRMHGQAALDLDALPKHAADLVAKLKQRCRREIGLGARP